MPDEQQLSRKREAVSISVPDKRGGTTIVTAYNGMLPAELLLELTHQGITFQIRNVSESYKESMWHGPDEKIQTAILSGLSAAPMEGK